MNEAIEIDVEGHASLIFRIDEVLNLIGDLRGEPPVASQETPMRIDRERFLLRICSQRLLDHVQHLDLASRLVGRRVGKELAAGIGDVRVIRSAQWGAVPPRDLDQRVLALIVFASNRDGNPPVETADLFRLYDPRIAARFFQYRAENLVLFFELLWMLKAEFDTCPRGCAVGGWVNTIQSSAWPTPRIPATGSGSGI